jgi:hypothetical protein
VYAPPRANTARRAPPMNQMKLAPATAIRCFSRLMSGELVVV